jgi:hypothetical protein
MTEVSSRKPVAEGRRYRVYGLRLSVYRHQCDSVKRKRPYLKGAFLSFIDDICVSSIWSLAE